MVILLTIVYFALFLYFLLMWARLIIELVTALSRGWRPRGFMLVLAEFSFTLTDPPVRTARRLLPPFRVGGISLDFAWSLVMLVVLVLLYVVSWASQLAG